MVTQPSRVHRRIRRGPVPWPEQISNAIESCDVMVVISAHWPEPTADSAASSGPFSGGALITSLIAETYDSCSSQESGSPRQPPQVLLGPQSLRFGQMLDLGNLGAHTLDEARHSGGHPSRQNALVHLCELDGQRPGVLRRRNHQVPHRPARHDRITTLDLHHVRTSGAGAPSSRTAAVNRASMAAQ